MRLSYDDWEHNNVVVASLLIAHIQVEKKFTAFQTPIGTLANQLDKLGATVAKQGHANQQLMKSMNENLSQQTSVVKQMPEVFFSINECIGERYKNSVDGGCCWSSQQKFWADTSDTAATRVTTKFERTLSSEKAIRSREFN